MRTGRSGNRAVERPGHGGRTGAARRGPTPPVALLAFAGLVFLADAGNGDQFFVSLSGNN